MNDASKAPSEPLPEPGTVPHRERLKQVDLILTEGKVGGICIDNTPEHRAWYLHELTKYPRLKIEYQGDLTPNVYLIRVRKEPSNN